MNVTMPDGTVIEGVPDNVTKAQLMDMLAKKGMKSTFTPTAREPVPGVIQPTDLDARVLGPGGMSAVRGARDVTQGAIRLGLRGLEAVGVTKPSLREDFEQHAAESKADFDAKMEKNFGPNRSGFVEGGGRALGQMAMTAPATALKVGEGVGLASRLVTNAIQGGAVGAILARPDHLAEDTVVGGATGMAVPEIVRGALGLIGKVANWTGLAGRPAGSVGRADIEYGDLTESAKGQLKEAGIDWDGLPDQTKANIKKWVFDNDGKTAFTPVEAARLGIFNSVGANPTKAMITQNFDDYAREDMLAHQRGGESLRDAYSGVNRAVGQNLEDQSLRLGGNTGDRPVSGLRVIDALQQGRDESKAAVTAAYDAVRADPRLNNKVSFAKVRQYLKNDDAAIISQGSTKDLKAGVEKWLTEQGALGQGAKPMSVEKVEAFKKWLNDRWNPKDKATLRMIRNLKDAADEAVMGVGKGDVFATARQAHRLTKETYDDKELIRKLLDQKNPVDRKVAVEDAWDEVVLRSDVAQLADLKNTLTKGARVTKGPGESETVARGNQAWKDTQTATMEWLIEKAKSSQKGPNDSPIYLHRSFKDALERIGKEKLNVMFGADGVKALNEVAEAMRLAKPIQGTTNPSGSGNRVIQFFQNQLPRMMGAAAGGAAGGGYGAAAGAAAADTVALGARSAVNAASAKTMTNANKAVNRERIFRIPPVDIKGAMVPPATTNALIQTGRDKENQ
jgi:hypothetical protein